MNTTLLYIYTVLVWGSTWIAIKYQLGDISPIVSIAHRSGLSALIMLAIMLPAGRLTRLDPRDHLFVLAQGLSMFSVNYLFIYAAAGEITSGLIAVVFSTMVILNIVNGALFMRVPVTGTVVVGAALGMIGMACVFLPELRALDFSPAALQALLLCALGTLCASAGNIIAVRNHRRQLPVLTCNVWGMFYGSIALYGLAAVRGEHIAIAWNARYVGSLLYLSLFGSVLAFWAYVTLIGRIGPGRASYTTLLFPIVALLISTVLEGYQWTLWALVGLTLVLSGNWIAMRRNRV
ncbi:MAG: DMT family transporter [Chromatocurvus sp.]